MSRDNCSICSEAGRNPIGHTKQFCGYPGGSYPTPQEGTAAKRAADKERFTATRSKQQGGVQIMNYLTELTSRDPKIKDLEERMEKMEDIIESLREQVNHNSLFIMEHSQEHSKREMQRQKVMKERQQKQQQEKEAKAKERAVQQRQWKQNSSSSSGYYDY